MTTTHEPVSATHFGDLVGHALLELANTARNRLVETWIRAVTADRQQVEAFHLRAASGRAAIERSIQSGPRKDEVLRALDAILRPLTTWLSWPHDDSRQIWRRDLRRAVSEEVIVYSFYRVGDVLKMHLPKKWSKRHLEMFAPRLRRKVVEEMEKHLTLDVVHSATGVRSGRPGILLAPNFEDQKRNDDWHFENGLFVTIERESRTSTFETNADTVRAWGPSTSPQSSDHLGTVCFTTTIPSFFEIVFNQTSELIEAPLDEADELRLATPAFQRGFGHSFTAERAKLNTGPGHRQLLLSVAPAAVVEATGLASLLAHISDIRRGEAETRPKAQLKGIAQFREQYDAVVHCAETRRPVFITGDTGTGKELMAHLYAERFGQTSDCRQRRRGGPDPA